VLHLGESREYDRQETGPTGAPKKQGNRDERRLSRQSAENEMRSPRGKMAGAVEQDTSEI